ncbi:hypothetical protein IWQ60_005883 [Tieghemiomyces parasiticus]|uniref:Uncharacterized protein n=1 Tax=Tieghemiomyces parasiticus TaxID=78921 RepID=A0A9W8DKR9_9FUNG|nr:hypothetical protein IWQ60_008932 [Tieghemiomyces parasiticus]KAJ1923440.1 hypothetical protein IWQ60_005883 [Tieghemiomyces parasiticus]
MSITASLRSLTLLTRSAGLTRTIQRGLNTSAKAQAEEAATATATKTQETIPKTSLALSTRPVDANPRRYTNLMDQIKREGIQRTNLAEGSFDRGELFLRRPIDRQRTMQAGDIVMVETLNSKTSNTTTKFVGFCLGVYRRGIDTSFTLRNIVMKLGVEIDFKAYSPMVKNIKILEKGKNYHRAKLYYIRKQPEKAFMFNNRKEFRMS